MSEVYHLDLEWEQIHPITKNLGFEFDWSEPTHVMLRKLKALFKEKAQCELTYRPSDDLPQYGWTTYLLTFSDIDHYVWFKLKYC